MGIIHRDRFLQGLKRELAASFGSRFKGLILFGSEARGDARPDSDIDILVLLTGVIRLKEDLAKISSVILPIEWAREPHRIIDATPVCYEDFQAGKWALYRSAKEEGITA